MSKSKLYPFLAATAIAMMIAAVVAPVGASAQSSALRLVNSVNTLSGTGIATLNGDGGAAGAASLNQPRGIATDGARNVFIADTGNNVVRRIDSITGITGIITTIAGTGSAGFSGDAGPAVSAQLSGPVGIAVDANGDIYIADIGNSHIRVLYEGGFISATANPLTFASTAVGSTSASQIVTAVLDGNLAYDFSAFALKGQFVQVNSGSTLVPQCALAAALSPGYSCSTALNFSPHTDGTVTGTEVFGGSAPTQTVQLTGTATGGTASTTTITLPTMDSRCPR